MRIALAALAAWGLAGCFGPSIDSGDLLCSDNICPDGLTCDRGVCVTEPGDGACGDGVINGPEACDDGNTVDGDGCTANCSAATCTVPITHPTVAEVIGDDACPTGYIMGPRIAERLTIDGDKELVGVGAGRPVIDGEGLGTVVTIGPGMVGLTNLTITGGRAERGGGIINEAALVLTDVEVTGNVVFGAPNPDAGGLILAGAGIDHLGGSLTLDRTEIRDNSADTAMAASQVSEVRGIGIMATAPVSMQDGSAVRANTAAYTLDQVGSAAAIRGVGLYIDGSALVIGGDSEVTDNVASATATDGLAVGLGAGIYAAESSTISCTRCAISRNRIDITEDFSGAVGFGAAIYAELATLILTDAVIADNAVVVAGLGVGAQAGALYLATATATLESSTVTGNQIDMAQATGIAGGRGGAITLSGRSPLTITASSISGNSITSGNQGFGAGAGIDVNAIGSVNYDIIMDRANLDNNSLAAAQAQGGALYASVSAPAVVRVSIQSSTISNNSVLSPNFDLGGGIALSSSGQLEVDIDNSTVSGNSSENGAGINVSNTSTVDSGALEFRMSFTTITANIADANGQGGGLRMLDRAGGTLFSLDNNLLTGNSAGSGADCATVDQASISGANNIKTDNGCAGTTIGDINGMAVTLGILADNGGETLTHSIAAGIAVDKSPGPCFTGRGTTVSVDQRGLPRPVGGRCDVGSFELQ